MKEAARMALVRRTRRRPDGTPSLLEVVEDLEDLIDLRDLKNARHLGLGRQQDEFALARHLRLRASDQRPEAERGEEIHEGEIHDDEGLSGCGDARKLQIDRWQPSTSMRPIRLTRRIPSSRSS